MQITLDADDMEPIIEAAIQKILVRITAEMSQFPDMVYTEPEAARLLKVPQHVLGDERRRGRVNASRVGRKIRYTRQDLIEYLAARRWKPKP